MDIEKLWQQVNEKVDLIMAGAGILVVLNLVAGFYLFRIYTAHEDLYERYNLDPTADYSEQMAELEALEDIEDEIEIEPAEDIEEADFPERYAELVGTDLFIPLATRRELGLVAPEDIELVEAVVDEDEEEPEDPDDPDDPDEEPEEEELPQIEGFEARGRIFIDDVHRVAIIRSIADEEDFVLRRGETIGPTDYRVKNISDTAITLTAPGYETTALEFPAVRRRDLKEYINLY